MELKKAIRYAAPDLKPGQQAQISSEEKIHAALKQAGCMGFNAYEGDHRIGFALLREYQTGCFFLWDFIIDRRHQGQGKGREILSLLLNHLKQVYRAQIITTTYKAGNEAA